MKRFILLILLYLISFLSEAQQLQGQYFLLNDRIINSVTKNIDSRRLSPISLRFHPPLTNIISDSTGKTNAFYLGPLNIANFNGIYNQFSIPKLATLDRGSFADFEINNNIHIIGGAMNVTLGSTVIVKNNLANVIFRNVNDSLITNNSLIQLINEPNLLNNRPLIFSSTGILNTDKIRDVAFNSSKLSGKNNFKFYYIRDDSIDRANNIIYSLQMNNGVISDTNWFTEAILYDTSSLEFPNSLVISPDQKKIAVIRPKAVLFYNINDLNGTLSFDKKINFQENITTIDRYNRSGMEISKGCFSPNSKLFYLVRGGRTSINGVEASLFKMDVSLPTEQATLSSVKGTHLRNLPSSERFWISSYIQLTPNGEIIIVNTSQRISFDSNTVIRPLFDSSGFVPEILFLKCPNDESNNFNFEELDFVNELILNYIYTPYTASFKFINADKLQILANRRLICLGDTTQLTAFGASTTRFQWQSSAGTGSLSSDTSRTPVFRANRLGEFELSVRGTSECTTATAAIRVRVVEAPRPNLGPDRFGCFGVPLRLNPNVPNIPGFTYLWNTGATTPTISVQDSGIYIVTVTAGTCSRSDTVRILGFDRPIAGRISASSLSICEQENSVTLRALNPNNLIGRFVLLDTLSSQRIIIVADSNGSAQLRNLPLGTTKVFWQARGSLNPECLSNSDTLSIIRLPQPRTSILGIRTICQGLPRANYRLRDTTLLNVSSLRWEVSGGSVLDSSANSLAIAWDTTLGATGFIKVWGVGKNGCRLDTLRLNIVVSSDLLPEAPLVPAFICRSDSFITASIPVVSEFSSYTWSVQNGVIVDSIINANRNEIRIRILSPNSSLNNRLLPIIRYRESVVTPLRTCTGLSDTAEINFFAPKPKVFLNEAALCSPFIGSLINSNADTFALQSVEWQWIRNLNSGGNSILPINQILSSGSSAFLRNPIFSFPAFSSDSTYTLLRNIIDRNGCLQADTLIINLLEKPVISIASDKPENYCTNAPAELRFTELNANYEYFYKLTPVGSVENEEFTPLNFQGSLSQGIPIVSSFQNNQVIKLFGRRMQIINGQSFTCFSDTLSDTVLILTPTPIDLGPNPQYICPKERIVTYRNFQTEGLNTCTWQAENGIILESDCNSATVQWGIPEELGATSNLNYRLTLNTLDDNSCTNSATLRLLYDAQINLQNSRCNINDYPLEVGQILYFNGDGLNENFRVPNLEFYGRSSLEIYNRYGIKQLEEANFQNQALPGVTNLREGMYYYLLKTTRGEQVKGWFVVVRE